MEDNTIMNENIVEETKEVISDEAVTESGNKLEKFGAFVLGGVTAIVVEKTVKVATNKVIKPAVEKVKAKVAKKNTVEDESDVATNDEIDTKENK